MRNDVVIIGGGPAGLTLAAMLGRAGFECACVERAPPPRKSGDIRTTALSYASMRFLRQGGVWAQLEHAACPILDIRVADGASSFFLDFHHREVGDVPFGWIVENGAFRQALQKRISSLKNIRCISGEMERLESDRGMARIRLRDGSTLEASLIVGADGRQSASRRLAGIRTYGWTYDQTAIVCTLAHTRPHHNIAVEHFLPGGPLATLPMKRQRSSVVWTEKTAAAAALIKMSTADFTEILQDKVGGWLGKIKVLGGLSAYPLSLIRAERYVADRFALIGDAAHGIHPIAGQGFNLGMGDIGVLAEELKRAAVMGLDIGGGDVLARYEKRRKFANGNMVFMTDVLDRLFSNALPPFEALRRRGLGAVRHMHPLRRFFMKTAMGRENKER
ncbi:MAG: UbiH/UbiF/VisC/COQ6 family ubiquinone biosynthesis hydroxylase [Bdellovibrionales bacterium]